MQTSINTTGKDWSDTGTAHPGLDWRYLITGGAALCTGLIFLVAVLDLALRHIQPGIRAGWLSFMQNNWLAVIFKLLAGDDAVRPDLLYRINLLDIIILALVGITFIGLFSALREISIIGSLIAVALPFLGILLFIATKTAGRCGVMGAELVISIVMLKSQRFGKGIAWAGIISSVLLLAGDIGASTAPSVILAVLMGIGYILLMLWLFLVAGKLFSLGSGSRSTK
ncbi:MAG: hypothetical protein EHM70_14285 [Chloroflexota bacterium]|nr:MAG: hypothetical protein EHM70_14285 [Chloroflexota bacterium]